MSDKETKPDIREEEPLKDINKNIENVNQSFLTKLKQIKSNITVEPIFAGLIISAKIARLATQNLNLEKACKVKLNLGDDICEALIRREGNLTYEAEAQKIISTIESWRTIIQTAIPTILVILMGAWSDRTGNRKLCILMPLVGELLVCISNLFSTYYFKEISVEVTVILETIFPAITGGWVMIYLGVFSYISDITSEKSRTFRIGLVNLCLTAGLPIGTALSGILLRLVGYYGVFLISGTIYMATLTYGFIYLKSNTKPQVAGDEKKEPVTCSEMLTLIKETVGVAFKKRESNFRMKIIVTLLLVALVYGPDQGEGVVFYMYTRYKLNWNAFRFSLYSTYNIITHSIGALFSISLFSKRWGFHDSVLCLISLLSNLAGSLSTAFVQTDLHMYMVPLVQILNATTFTALRSMASKLVSNEEMGKMNSLISLVETLAALIFDPSYSIMYAKTITIFSGTVFIFSAIMLLPSIGMISWIYRQHRREISEIRRLQTKEITVYENQATQKEHNQ